MRNCPQLWLPAVGLSLLAFGFSAVGIVLAQGIEPPPAPLPALDSVIDNSATIQEPAPAALPEAVPTPAPVAIPAPVIAEEIAAPIPVESAVPEPVTLPEPVQMPTAVAPVPAPVQAQQAPVQAQQAPVQFQQAPVQFQQAPVQVQQAPVQFQQAPVQAQQAPVQVQQGPVYYQPQPVFGGLLPPLRVYRAGEFNGSSAPAYGGSMYGGRPAMGMAPRRGAQIDSRPYYTTRGPRDFYLQNPRPLGP